MPFFGDLHHTQSARELCNESSVTIHSLHTHTHTHLSLSTRESFVLVRTIQVGPSRCQTQAREGCQGKQNGFPYTAKRKRFVMSAKKNSPRWGFLGGKSSLKCELISGERILLDEDPAIRVVKGISGIAGNANFHFTPVLFSCHKFLVAGIAQLSSIAAAYWPSTNLLRSWCTPIFCRMVVGGGR